MAACQARNQPPRRTRHCRAHTFRISQIPIAERAAFFAPHPPRVPSLAAFGRRPPVMPRRCRWTASETLNRNGHRKMLIYRAASSRNVNRRRALLFSLIGQLGRLADTKNLFTSQRRELPQGLTATTSALIYLAFSSVRCRDWVLLRYGRRIERSSLLCIHSADK
jgi:hypothetical protein